jgi:hypothetical protein
MRVLYSGTGGGTPRSPLQTLSAPKPKKEVGMTLTQINLFNPSYLQVWFPLRARRKDADPTWQAGPQDVGLIWRWNNLQYANTIYTHNLRTAMYIQYIYYTNTLLLLLLLLFASLFCRFVCDYIIVSLWVAALVKYNYYYYYNYWYLMELVVHAVA